MEKPKDFMDVVALVGFDDIDPVPAVGFTVTENDKTIFFVKLNRAYVDWDRIEAWRYLRDLWPDYLDQEESQ